LAVLHHESNVLQFANIGYRVSGNGDQIGEFPGSIVPTRFCQPSISAALIVRARIARPVVPLKPAQTSEKQGTLSLAWTAPLK
jgi:hypothetical protein